jgi:predicted P-loop ATPase
MTKSEVEKVKAFVSRRVDRYRPSYGRNVIEQPRTCIFAGTTNASAYLRDETGARRYLPIKCGAIALNAIKRDRDQLWAEAVALLRKGEPWWLVDTAVIATAQDEQAARFVPDAWGEIIAEFVEHKNETSVSEVLEHALFLEKSRWDRASQTRAGTCLTTMGWTQKRASTPGLDGKRPRKYYRPKANGVGRGDGLDG